jgi:hypothetical protein
MTGLAAIDADAGVFEDEGSALFDVAFEAGLFIDESLGDEAWALAHPPGGRVRAVRIMAV